MDFDVFSQNMVTVCQNLMREYNLQEDCDEYNLQED